MPTGLTLLCVLLLAWSNNGFAQDTATDCDKYAASDADPSGKAPGVPFDKVNPVLAVRACMAAVRQSPNNARFLFQLGRAYQTDNKLNLALEYFRKAAEKNYAAAQESLGDMYTTGLLLDGQGVPPDDQQAATWHRKAAEQGLPSAQSKLATLPVAEATPTPSKRGNAHSETIIDENDRISSPQAKGCAFGSPTSGRILVKMSGVKVMQGPGADTTRVINKLASQGGKRNTMS